MYNHAVHALKAPRAALLFSFLLVCTAANAQQWNPSTQDATTPRMIVHDLGYAGVTFIPPEEPTFDYEVSQIVPAQVASVALAFKPFLVIVANSSPQTIVAYSVIWRITEKNGQKSIIVLPFKYPDGLADVSDSGAFLPNDREDRGVRSGEKRLITTDMEIDSSWEDPYYLEQLRSFPKGTKQEYASADEVEITLDAVLFSDGLLVGPNQTSLDQDFMAYFESKQNLFRQVANDLDSGKTIDEALAPVAALTVKRVSPRDSHGFYQMLAAQDINALWRRIGDAEMGETVRNAIRREPFVIRKSIAASKTTSAKTEGGVQ